MIRGVIFDLGGVLIDNPASKMRTHISNKLGISEKEYSERSSKPMNLFQKGLISEDDFWKKVTKGMTDKRESSKSLWKEAIKSTFSPKLEMLDMIEKLRESGLKIGILSNTEVPVIEYLQEISFDTYDVQVYSCLEKTNKPERIIYSTITDRMDMKPYELVFIDDTMENIIAGQSMGLHCILFITLGQVKEDLFQIIDKEKS